MPHLGMVLCIVRRRHSIPDIYTVLTGRQPPAEDRMPPRCGLVSRSPLFFRAASSRVPGHFFWWVMGRGGVLVNTDGVAAMLSWAGNGRQRSEIVVVTRGCEGVESGQVS